MSFTDRPINLSSISLSLIWWNMTGPGGPAAGEAGAEDGETWCWDSGTSQQDHLDSRRASCFIDESPADVEQRAADTTTRDFSSRRRQVGLRDAIVSSGYWLVRSTSDCEIAGSSTADRWSVCSMQSGPGLRLNHNTQPSILSKSVNEYRLRLGRYKAGLCDAAWTWAPLRCRGIARISVWGPQVERRRRDTRIEALKAPRGGGGGCALSQIPNFWIFFI